MSNKYAQLLADLRELYRYPKGHSKDMYSRDIRTICVSEAESMPDTPRGEAVSMILAGLSRRIKRNEEIAINKHHLLIALDAIGLVCNLDWRVDNKIDTSGVVEVTCTCELPDNNPHCEAEFHNF